MRTFILSLFTICGLFATPALAQFDANSFNNQPLTIELQPEFPRPGETVTATINDYGGGTYGSSIIWLLDGQEVPEATNQRQALLTAGTAGVTQTIKVILNKPQGGKEIITSSITPIYLDVIIEPQTRTPDFYLGRALPSIGSSVNATALISGEGFNDSDLVYTWRLNRKVIEGGPIRGRNNITFTTPMGDNMILSVAVTKLNGTMIARRSMLIPSVTPTIHFYEVSSLFGVNQVALDKNFILIGNSAVIQAEPYNLDSRVYNNPDIHQWEINDTKFNNTGNNPYEVTLQRTGVAGLTELNFHVRDMTQILQGTESSIQINF